MSPVSPALSRCDHRVKFPLPVLILCHPALLGRSHRVQVCWNSSLESTRPLVSPCRSRAVFGAVLAVLAPCQARGLRLPRCLHVGRLEELLLSCRVETGAHLTLHVCCKSRLCFSVPRYLLDWQGGNPDLWFLPPRDLINRTNPCCAVSAGDRPPQRTQRSHVAVTARACELLQSLLSPLQWLQSWGGPGSPKHWFPREATSSQPPWKPSRVWWLLFQVWTSVVGRAPVCWPHRLLLALCAPD